MNHRVNEGAIVSGRLFLGVCPAVADCFAGQVRRTMSGLRQREGGAYVNGRQDVASKCVSIA